MYGHYSSQMGDHYRQQMGADCAPGYYETELFGIKTGVCVPTAETLAKQAAAGAISSVASGAASSPGVIAAAESAGAAALGQRIINFYKEKPVIAFGATAAVLALVVYGTMSFLKK